MRKRNLSFSFAIPKMDSSLFFLKGDIFPFWVLNSFNNFLYNSSFSLILLLGEDSLFLLLVFSFEFSMLVFGGALSFLVIVFRGPFSLFVAVLGGGEIFLFFTVFFLFLYSFINEMHPSQLSSDSQVGSSYPF